MLQVFLTSATGRRYELTGSGLAHPVLAPEGGLVELVGRAQRSDVAVPGRAGVLAGRRRYGPIAAAVPFFLHAADGEQLERVYAEFRQGWSMDTPSVLEVHADHHAGPFLLDLLLDREIDGVPVDMRRRTSSIVSVPVFSPEGMYRTRGESGTGTVTVTNWGDSVLYPSIRYSGPGGEVTAPSGARFTLPVADMEMVVPLDPQSLRLEGAFPEGVLPGSTATWVVPEGAALEWSVRVADPWA